MKYCAIRRLLGLFEILLAVNQPQQSGHCCITSAINSILIPESSVSFFFIQICVHKQLLKQAPKQNPSSVESVLSRVVYVAVRQASNCEKKTLRQMSKRHLNHNILCCYPDLTGGKASQQETQIIVQQ